MRLRPVGLAGVGHAVAQHEPEQLLLGTAARPDGVGARAAQVADGLVFRRGDVDRFEFASAQQTGLLLRILLVRLDLVPGLLRDLGWRDDDAVVVELDEASREDEAGRTRLVADAEIFLGDAELLAQLRERALDAEVATGSFAVEDGIGAVGRRVGDGD